MICSTMVTAVPLDSLPGTTSHNTGNTRAIRYGYFQNGPSRSRPSADGKPGLQQLSTLLYGRIPQYFVWVS